MDLLVNSSNNEFILFVEKDFLLIESNDEMSQEIHAGHRLHRGGGATACRRRIE